MSAGRAASAATTVALLRRFWPFMKADRRWFAVGLAMLPLVAAFSTLRPLLAQRAIDGGIASGNLLELRVLALAFLVAVVAEFASQAVQVWSLQRAGYGTLSRVRTTIFRHVLRLPARYFDRHPIGGLLSRTTSDVEALGETIAFGVFTVLTDAAMILAMVVAMASLDLRLTLWLLLLAPLLWVMVRWFGAQLRRLQLEIRRSQAAQTGYLAEQLGGVTVVQLFGREAAAVEEYRRLGRRFLRATQHANIYDATLYSLMDGIAAFAVALLLWVAVPALAPGSQGDAPLISLGVLFAFVDYLQRLFFPIREFSGKLATVQRAVASLERIYELLDEPAEVPDEGVSGRSGEDLLVGWHGGLRLRDVRFAYNEGAVDVLGGVDLDVAPGEIVAIVGRTGSGKTTLGRLLTRLYDGYRGSIELVGVPDRDPIELREVPSATLRRHLLALPQDPFLFQGDVAFNVSLSEERVEADAPRIDAVLREVQLAEALAARGGGACPVGERGAGLSAGEAQLVAFARVLAGDPTLLVLDEATASVDSLTEVRLQQAVARTLRGRTAIVIAHRLSTVRRAHRIAVMVAGRIVEQGTHDELVARDGEYARLLRAGEDEPDALH